MDILSGSKINRLLDSEKIQLCCCPIKTNNVFWWKLEFVGALDEFVSAGVLRVCGKNVNFAYYWMFGRQ